MMVAQDCTYLLPTPNYILAADNLWVHLLRLADITSGWVFSGCRSNSEFFKSGNVDVRKGSGHDEGDV